jgi:hypothetical protein
VRAVAVVLVAAAVTVLVGATAAAVRVVRDPEVRDCAAASTAAAAANSAHQDAMRVLEGRFRRGGAPADMARLRVEEAKGELDAARARLTLLCHYPTDNSSQNT